MKKNLAAALYLLLFVSTVGSVSLSAVTLEELNDEFTSLGFAIATKPLPSIDFELENLDGETESLSDYRGKVVFLNFWATWCGPCRYEIPSMQELYEKYREDGLEIVAVNLGENQRTVTPFVEDNDLTFPVLLDTSNYVGSIYGARSIPTTYIVGRDGNILSMFVGAREWDTDEVYTLFDNLLAYNQD